MRNCRIMKQEVLAWREYRLKKCASEKRKISEKDKRRKWKF